MPAVRDSLERKLGRAVGRAVADFSMIEEGDRIMVAVSGGKDSYTMLHLLRELQKRAPVRFELRAVHLDQGHPGYDGDRLRDWLERHEYPHSLVKEDTYSIVTEKIPEGKTYCSLCSRLRRGILYRLASELGCTKIALGHHRDDILETFFLNLFFGGKLKAMPPKLGSDDGKHVVIRPLAYVKEKDLARYAEVRAFPIIPCDLCGSQDHLQRKQVKQMLRQWEKEFPGRVETIFNSLQRVSPSHLLDRKLFDFPALAADGAADEDGDKAFDAEDFSTFATSPLKIFPSPE